MDYETMRRLRESDPGKFTGIGREKGGGNGNLAGVNPGGQQVPNARLASELRNGPPADDPLARIPGYYDVGPSTDPGHPNYVPAHKRQSPARTPGSQAGRRAAGASSTGGQNSFSSANTAGMTPTRRRDLAMYDDEFNEDKMTYTREFAGQRRCAECNKWGVKSQYASSEWAKEVESHRHCKGCAKSKWGSAGKFALAAAAIAAPPPKLKDDRVSSTSTSTLRKSKTGKAIEKADAKQGGAKQGGKGAKGEKTSPLPEIRRSSLFPEGYSVATQMKSKFHKEDMQRSVPRPKPLTVDEFKRTKEYRDVVESDTLVANTLREVREREENTKREIESLKQKRQEQRRFHVDTVESIRADADRKLRGAGPLNLLNKGGKGGSGTSSTPNKSNSGSPATYKSGESPEERADRLAAEEVRARLSASADPSRGPIYDPARSPVVHGAITPEERRRRTVENADRKRREFAEKVHAVEVASPNGRESFDAVYAAIESPEIQKKISPPKPQRSPAPTTYGNQSPGTNLKPRALDTSGGYDSSPDSLNGSHRSPGRVSFKEDAPTPSKNDLIAKMKGMLAEAKAPEERKKVNAAVNVWTDASRGLLPAINPLSIPGTRGILKTPSSGTGSLGDSPPKEEYYCARCGVKQPDPYANFCGGCGTAVDLKKLDNSKKKQQKAGPLDTSDIKLPVGPGGRQLSYRGSIEHELRAIEARDGAKGLNDGSKWKLAQDRYNAGDAFGNVHRLPSYLAATDDHGELYREEEDKVFRATNKYGFSLDMYGPPKRTPKRVARSPQTYHRMHNKAFGSYLYVDRWGDTGAEERVNRIQHSDKRRCVSCGLFGKQIRFSDREWDASAPKCRSCEVAPRDAVTGPKLPRAKHFMRPTAANQNFAGAYDDDNYSEDNFYQSLYGTSEQEHDPFDDLPSAGKPKERVRPVSGKHKPAWNNVTSTGRGFSENKFKSMSKPNPQWNKSSEVTPATKQTRRAPAEQLIDFDGAPKSKKDSPGGGIDGPPSPGAGLWYGSSVSSPQKAYQVLVDACKLKEEDCFLYLSKRYGRYSEASRGREARGEALAHLKDFLQKAEQKGLVPDWWSNENTSELCRAAQVPNNPYHLKLIKIGEPMTTATEIATRWGLAGTESLRDLHFDIDPSPWHGYRAPTPPDNRQSQYAFKSGETPLDKKIAEVLGKAPHGARKDAASSRQSDRPKWEHDTPLYDRYGDPIDQDGDDGYGYDEDDGEYSDGGTFYPFDDYNDYEDDGEYSHGGTFYPYEDPFDDYEVASMVKPPSEYHARPRAPEPKQFDDGFIAGMGMKQADDDFIAGMGMKQAPGPGAAVVKSSPAKSPKSLPSDADLRNIGIDTSTMSAEEKRALGLDGSDPAKAAALAEAVDRLRIESGPSNQTSPAAEKGTKGGTISDWAGGKDTGTSNKPMSERKKAAAAVWDDISSDEEDPRVSDGRWKPKPMLVGKNFLEQQLAERTHWEPLKPGFITSGAPPTPPMKSKQAEMARMWRNKTQAKKGGKVNMKEFGVMAMLGAGGKGVKRDKALSAFMSSKKNENAGGVTADTAGKSTATRGGGFKKFGQAVLQQSNAGPVTENWSPKRTGVSFADDSNSTHSKVLDLTGKAQAPLVNNALVLSGRSRWGTYEEDDTYANAVKSALGSLGVEIRGGHRRGGRNVSVESHRAAVLLGVGGTGTDTLGESANFLTDPEWLRSLLEFVSKGGVLVVQGDGEPAERVFSLFNLPWRFAPSGRERADFSWNHECLVTSRDASSEHWRGWNGGFRVYNARSALLTGVNVEHAVFTRPDSFGEIEAEESLLAAVAAATYGDGLVCFVGDDNGEEETVDLVARLATTPRVG